MTRVTSAEWQRNTKGKSFILYMYLYPTTLNFQKFLFNSHYVCTYIYSSDTSMSHTISIDPNLNHHPHLNNKTPFRLSRKYKLYVRVQKSSIFTFLLLCLKNVWLLEVNFYILIILFVISSIKSTPKLKTKGRKQFNRKPKNQDFI